MAIGLNQADHFRSMSACVQIGWMQDTRIHDVTHAFGRQKWLPPVASVVFVENCNAIPVPL